MNLQRTKLSIVNNEGDNLWRKVLMLGSKPLETINNADIFDTFEDLSLNKKRGGKEATSRHTISTHLMKLTLSWWGGAYPSRSFMQVRQWGEINWESLLQPSVCAAAERPPRLVRPFLSRFYCCFIESFKSCFLLLVALPGLTDTLSDSS